MTLRTLAAVTACLSLAAPVLAQSPAPPTAPSDAPATAPSPNDALPDGPGKSVVVRVCTECHDASQFAAARYSPDEWDNEVSKMESAGADITAEDHATIAAYLARHLPKAPPAGG